MELEKKLAEQFKNHTAELDKKMEALEKALKAGAQKEDLVNLEKSIQADKDIQAKMQEQLDAIAKSIKENAAKTSEVKKSNFNTMLEKNFDNISDVSSTKSFKLELKDMTLATALTGDQPRDYSNDVVTRPAQMTNVSDLAQSFPITGGTYTYTRSTLVSGAVTTQVEGASKAQLEYDYAMIDANTDFIAGIAVYSRKMKNNLSFLENTLSTDLRRDYYRGENTVFSGILASEATASTLLQANYPIKVEMLIAEIAKLNAIDFMPNAIVVTPADYWDILITEKSTGAGYGLPGVVTFENGVLRINGIEVRMATWLAANKYYVGDWSRFRNPITEGFSFEVSDQDKDNFSKNNITARVESQSTVTVEQPDAIVYGDFLAA